MGAKIFSTSSSKSSDFTSQNHQGVEPGCGISRGLVGGSTEIGDISVSLTQRQIDERTNSTRSSGAHPL